jgi:threonine synthase
MTEWAAICRRCGRTSPLEEFAWRCGCGGLLDVTGPAVVPSPAAGGWSLWRYAEALPPLAVAGSATVTMGEGMTPLVREGRDADVWLKLDFLNPTLSFKDRGAAVLVAAMSAAGIRSVVADSSGNAGAALAAYTARAGMAAEVFVPASTSEGKQAAIACTGATVRSVPGDRAAAAGAALRRVGSPDADGAPTVYASHVHQPLFVQGTKTCAYELWEQLGGHPPGTVVAAAGNGSMVLGLHLGFAELQRAGLIDRTPAIVAVQARRCAPLAGLVPDLPTVAEGIAIADPPRADQIREALGQTPVLLAGEEEIGVAQRTLGARGLDVEPTSAAVWAAWTSPGTAAHRAHLPGPVVLVLGGAGAKARRAP